MLKFIDVDAWARWIGPDVVLVHFPWSIARVEEFRASVPGRYRRWVADERAWRVRWPWAEPAMNWLLSHYPLAEVSGAFVPRLRTWHESTG